MQTGAAMRERLFTMRMSDEEHERANLVAAHYGLNLAGTVRMLLKREADALKAPASPPPRKPRKR